MGKAVSLAEAMRPASLEEMAGNPALVGPHGLLTKELKEGRPKSSIFWGPPGCGKTTAARIIAEASRIPVVALDATRLTLKDLRDATDGNPEGVLVYIDEVQFLDRRRQQALLAPTESGEMTLIAATTENPWHALGQPLLSRVRTLAFEPVPKREVERVLERALAQVRPEGAKPGVLGRIAEGSAGDVRLALRTLEDALALAPAGSLLDKEALEAVAGQGRSLAFDERGDAHYALVSALQKSIRGSDPDAAVFYLARLLEAKDIVSPARRLLVTASEDIGLADPMALPHTLACVEAAERLGLPEATKPLTQATIYLALSPKSYSIEEAYGRAKEDIDAGRGAVVPAHIASECAPGYVWPQNLPDHWTDQPYLPKDLEGRTYYDPHDAPAQRAPFDYWADVRRRRRGDAPCAS